MRTTDYYEVLGLDPQADQDEIKRAFRSLARSHHPDANDGNHDSAETYKSISEAYSVLSDPQRRAQYDQSRMFAGSGGLGGFVGDLFSDFFGQRSSRPTRVRQGRSIAFRATVTLQESRTGVVQQVEVARMTSCTTCRGEGTAAGTHVERCSTCTGTGVSRSQRKTILGTMVTEHECSVCRGTGSTIPDPCHACNGEGRVEVSESVDIEIPAGAQHGQEFAIRGGGDAGVAGGPAGDLIYVIDVSHDDRFRRVNDDLVCVVDVPMTVAALGGWLNLDTYDGVQKLEIAKGSQHGSIVTIPGLGFPKRNRRATGDLLVVLDVTTPRHVDRSQRKLLTQLAEMRGDCDGDKAVARNPSD